MVKRWLVAGSVGVVVLLCSLAAQGTSVVELDDAQLVERSTTILHGDVTHKNVRVVAETGAYYTEYVFAVRELIKGDQPTTTEVVFREWGGEMGGLRYWLPGTGKFNVGDEVVVFLGKTDPRTGIGFTTGLAQGKFRVEHDGASSTATAVRELGELRLVDQKTGLEHEVPKIERRKLPQLLNKVKSLLRKSR